MKYEAIQRVIVLKHYVFLMREREIQNALIHARLLDWYCATPFVAIKRKVEFAK